MLIKTYSLRPHCVSCWTIYTLQNDTRTLQCQITFVTKERIHVRLLRFDFLVHVSVTHVYFGSCKMGAAMIPFFLGFDATPMSKRIPTFRRYVVPSFSRINKS